MSVEHYWGAQAIAHRMGLRNPKSFLHAYKQGRAFAFKRPDPRFPCRIMWYSNSDLMARCELQQCRVQLEDFMAKQAATSQEPPHRRERAATTTLDDAQQQQRRT